MFQMIRSERFVTGNPLRFTRTSAPAAVQAMEKRLLMCGMGPELSPGHGGHPADTSGDAVVAVEAQVAAADIIAPTAVADLRIGNQNGQSGARVRLVDLDWTAPIDEGDADPENLAAASYDVRFSTQPNTDANWDAATPVVNPESAPQDAGSAETFNATGLSPSTTYYFAIKSTDEAGNVSGLSNVVSATTMATDTMHISGLGVALSFPGGWQRRPVASVAVADSAGYPVIGVTVSGYWSGPLKGTNTTGSGTTVLTGYGYAAAEIVHPKSFNCPRRGGSFYFTANNVVDPTGAFTWDGVAVTEGTGCY